jgi:hypothetical protein
MPSIDSLGVTSQAMAGPTATPVSDEADDTPADTASLVPCDQVLGTSTVWARNEDAPNIITAKAVTHAARFRAMRHPRWRIPVASDPP